MVFDGGERPCDRVVLFVQLQISQYLYMRLGQAPTLKLFSPLAAAAEKNRTEPGATALNKRPRGSIVNGRYDYDVMGLSCFGGDWSCSVIACLASCCGVWGGHAEQGRRAVDGWVERNAVEETTPLLPLVCISARRFYEKKCFGKKRLPWTRSNFFCDALLVMLLLLQ